MTGIEKRPLTIIPLLLGLALLIAATTVGCGKKSAPAPEAAQASGTSAEPAPSGAVETVVYDEGRLTLVVTLAGGSSFEYTAVPREVGVGIMAAPERGVYFSTYVRDRYPFQLITSMPPGLIGNRGHSPKPEKPPKSSRGRGRGR